MKMCPRCFHIARFLERHPFRLCGGDPDLGEARGRAEERMIKMPILHVDKKEIAPRRRPPRGRATEKAKNLCVLESLTADTTFCRDILTSVDAPFR